MSLHRRTRFAVPVVVRMVAVGIAAGTLVGTAPLLNAQARPPRTEHAPGRSAPDSRNDDDWNGWGDRDRSDRADRGRDRRDDRRDDGRLSWRGEVDDVVDIRIQGRHIDYRTRSGKPLRNVRVDLRGNTQPRRPALVNLDVTRGRGSVLVLQEPNARNGFTTIIRVVDRRSGYGKYDFDLRWY